MARDLLFEGLVRIAKCLLVAGAGLVLSGCPNDAGELRACDPLRTGPTHAVKLTNVLGIGRAADGRLFVVDHPTDGEPRLFVSDGDVLRRREVSGSGSSNADGFDRLGLLAEGAMLRVLVERAGDRVRMAIVEGTAARDRTLDISAVSGELLEVLDRAAIAKLRVLDLPNDVTVEYSARVEGGDRRDRLVVIRPAHDFAYEDFRLFYGPADALEEREVKEVSRARDGGSTHIWFELGSQTADVFFPNRILAPGEIEDEPATLEVGSKCFAVERLPDEEPELDGLEFICLTDA